MGQEATIGWQFYDHVNVPPSILIYGVRCSFIVLGKVRSVFKVLMLKRINPFVVGPVMPYKRLSRC